MKPGTVFEHKHWLDTSNRPLLCIVTAIRADAVHWAIWQAGESRPKGKYWFNLDDINKYVKSIIQEVTQ